MLAPFFTMIIKKDYGLVNIEHKDSTGIYTHAQDIDPTIEELKQRATEQSDNGFSKDRTMRYVGSIPFIEIERNPGLKEALLSGDTTAINNAMRIFFSSPDGSKYMVNKLDTGRSGHIRIK